MNTFKRLLRHVFTTAAAGERAFPKSTLDHIQVTIAKGEDLHRAEVRMMIEAALPLYAVLRKTTSRARARELFSLYRIWDTEENCGILIYVNLADHKVEIIADRTIGCLISSEDWQAVCHTMTKDFACGIYHDSVIAALEQLNTLLHAHFPATQARRNQLSDKPMIL